MTGHWTGADDAELDALTWTLVDGWWQHRDRCDLCQRRRPCPQLRAAIDEVEDWRTHREILSRAEALRAEQKAAA